MSDHFTYEEMTTEAQKAKVDADLKRHKITQEEETKRQQVEETNKTERSKNRIALLGSTLAGLAVVAVLAGIGFLIFTWTTGPDSPEDNTEIVRERECLANGGGWVPEDLFEYSDSGLCIYPGKTAEVPDGE